jgi:glutamine cyclotransferase
VPLSRLTPARRAVGRGLLRGGSTLAAAILLTMLPSPGEAAGPSPPAPVGPSSYVARQLQWEVVRSTPHDPQAFLQGLVWSYLDLTGLRGSAPRPEGAVLNGIAYDPACRRLFVGGKLWPMIFEIRVR